MNAADKFATDGTRARIEIAIAVVEDAGRFLIGLRPADVALGNLWEFPGGKVENGETPEAAAQRECLEEAGLEVQVTARYPIALHDYQHARLRLHFFACHSVRQQRPLPERFRWVRADELAQYEFPPANAALIQWLQARD